MDEIPPYVAPGRERRPARQHRAAAARRGQGGAHAGAQHVEPLRRQRQPVERGIALRKVDRALLRRVVDRHGGAGVQQDVGIDGGGVRRGRRAHTPQIAHDDARAGAARLDQRQRICLHMFEGGGDILPPVGQRQPRLDAGQRRPAGAYVGGRAFGMDDAGSRGHQIDRPRRDPRIGAQRVAMLERAVEQVGDGRQPDMRVRAHVDPAAGRQMRRPHLVEEDERPHHGALAMRQGAVDLEPAQIVGDGFQRLEHQVVVNGHDAHATTLTP